VVINRHKNNAQLQYRKMTSWQ